MRGTGAGLFRGIGSTLRPVFDGRPWLDPVVLGVLAFVGAAAVGLLGRMPVAYIHDEFAYLLIGETFANGRLTNPTPPFWEHLETFHVLMVPSYTGKYPPAQGVALAVGFLLGHPILGVWLSSAAMVAAVTWMLQAWLPRGWAAAGGALVLLQLGVVGYWAQSYWGGAVAAIGGALVYGAARRLWERPRVAQGLVLGVGLLILANSRPMEGLVASLPVAAVLAVKLVRSKGWADRLRLTVPTTAVLIPGFVWMGVYNHAVTGSATTMPYQEYSDQYATAPNLLFLSPRSDPPEYRHPEFRQFWIDWDMTRYDVMTTVDGFSKTRAAKLALILGMILGPGIVGLIFLGDRIRDPWVRVAGGATVATVGLTLLAKAAHPHYAAPVGPLLIFLAIAGWERAASLRPPRFNGALVVSVACAVCIATAFGRSLFYIEQEQDHLVSQLRRTEVMECLDELRSPSIVLVEHSQFVSLSNAWVWNAPDPFASHVLWARSMLPAGDADLIAAVPTRAVWKVTFGAHTSDGNASSSSPELELVRAPRVGRESPASAWEVVPPCR